ncbi:MAG: SdiA-regulated domain-containing protein [bacterium]
MKNKTKSLFFIIAAILLTGAGRLFWNTEETEKIKRCGEYLLSVPEPSGLAIAYDNKSLWTIGDGNSTVYNITFSGKIIKKFKVTGVDLEGISVIDENTICVVQEARRELLFVDYTGKELNRVKIKFKGERNSGFEGISYDSKNKIYFIVNEKKPVTLITINQYFEIINTQKINAVKDLSDVFYDEKKELLWLVSDESNMVLKCKRDGTIIQKYKVSIKQIEGICIDKENRFLYLVSDPENKLYKFELK